MIALPATVATLRLLRFPAMHRGDLLRAARFEADRVQNWETTSCDTVVRVHPVDRAQNLYALGVARQDALGARTRCIRQAGLTVIGADHEAYALRRAFPNYDAAIDIGHSHATLHAFSPGVPFSLSIPGGASEITRAIAADLSIDVGAAEKRKRILGTAGAGESCRDALAYAIKAAVTKARERCTIRSIALTGNGSRLAGLAAAVESSSEASVETPLSPLLDVSEYPDDVIRSAAQDWTMAIALAAWGAVR